MTGVIISMIARLLSLPPLLVIFYCIFRSFWEKINSINGLRKTRVTLMILLFSLILDNVIFFFLALRAYLVHDPIISVPTFLLIFDKLAITLAFYGFYYLFRHASKKD